MDLDKLKEIKQEYIVAWRTGYSIYTGVNPTDQENAAWILGFEAGKKAFSKYNTKH